MANYTKATDFASKDALLTGDPLKIVKGTEIDDEFNAIATAVNSKSNTESPTFTGTPTAPTAAAGTNTTQLATTAHVYAERSSTATLTNKTLTSPTITTPTLDLSGITSSGDLAVADGGTGASTATAARTNLGLGTLSTVSPTGTGSSSTFLRGDNTWAVTPNQQSTTLPDVGTYIIAGNNTDSDLLPGGTIAGTNLLYAYNGSHTTWSSNFSTTSPGTGTWRAMCRSQKRTYDGVYYSYYPALFVRVS